MTTPPDGLDPTVETSPPVAPEAAPPPTRADVWIELLGHGDAMYEHPDLFSAAFDAITQILQADPDAVATVGRVIDSRVSKGNPEQSLADITEALQVYLGVDGAYLLNWLAYEDAAGRLERVASVAAAPVTAFLRRALAENGGTLDFVQRAAFTGVDEWLRIAKNAYIDTLTMRQVFIITLVKVDGTSMRLECSPDSLLNLTTHLLELVNASPSRGSFSPERLAGFWDRLQDTVDLITREDEPDPELDDPAEPAE